MEHQHPSSVRSIEENDPEENENLLDNSCSIQPQIVPLEAERAIKNYEDVTIRKRYKQLLNFVDSLGALAVVVVLVVGFWRGSWILGDLYLVNVPHSVIIIVATSVHVILILWKDWCARFSEETKRTIFMTVFRRFHTFLFAQACVFTFKGYWSFLDVHYGVVFLPDTRVASYENPLLFWGVSAASFGALLILKCFKSSLGPPFGISVDDRDTSFNFPTMFRTNCTFVVQFSLGVHHNFLHFDKLVRNRFIPKASKLINEVVSVEEQPLMELSYLNENEIIISPKPPPYYASSEEPIRNPYFFNNYYQLSPRPFVNGPRVETPYRIQPIDFPQISVYQKIAPKNIETILAHITAYHKRKEIEKLQKKPAEDLMNEIVHKMVNNKYNLLKPDDPKDINMLSLSHDDPEADEYNGKVMVGSRPRRKEKPVEVIMSIYTNPMEWRFPNLVTGFQRHEVEPFVNKENLKKAVLHMEIYPEGEYSKFLPEISA